MTEVKFRICVNDVIALFPYEIADYQGNCESYMKLQETTHAPEGLAGQHSSANYFHIIQQSRPATTEEFAELRSELEHLGYELKVIKRRNANRAMEAVRSKRSFIAMILTGDDEVRLRCLNNSRNCFSIPGNS